MGTDIDTWLPHGGAMAGPAAGLARCEAPGFLALHGGELLTMDCGSSWEVDLRADADCDNPSLRRCHPRYTWGWQHREVNLFRAGGETGGGRTQAALMPRRGRR